MVHKIHGRVNDNAYPKEPKPKNWKMKSYDGIKQTIIIIIVILVKILIYALIFWFLPAIKWYEYGRVIAKK